MNKSESIVNISAALVKAQRNIGSALKGTKNPFFGAKFANLGSVMEACKEALNDQGVSVLQPVVSTTEGDFVETILLHECGEFFSSAMRLKVSKEDMQQFGSAVSYARRYGLQSMVFIPAEDDDGEATMNRVMPTNKTTPVTNKVLTSQLPQATAVELVPPAPQAPAVSPPIPQKVKPSFKKKPLANGTALVSNVTTPSVQAGQSYNPNVSDNGGLG